MTAPTADAPATAEPTPEPPTVDPAPPEPATQDDPAATIARLEADLKSARAEAGKSRVTAKQNAADEARAEMAQQIGKALGLVKDDEPADPAKLTAQVTEASAAAKQAKLELAVYRAAQSTDADPSALLDSRTFLEKAATLDPSDAAAIAAAIAEAVTANPRLGRPEQVAQGMKRNPAQGASASPPLGVNERIAAATAAGDTRLAIRLKAAMALNPNQ